MQAEPEQEPEVFYNSRGRRRRPKYWEVTARNDIKYKGPFSYRYIKILGWLLIVLSSLGTALTLIEKARGNVDPPQVYFFLKMSFDWAIPLLMIAAFAVVLNGQDNYRQLIAVNTLIAIAFAAGYFFIYERYIISGLSALTEEKSKAREAITKIFSEASSKGYAAFNIFIDMTLFSWVMFFVNYKPKMLFQGKKIYFFRGLILLPFGYEIASICMKTLAGTHSIALSPYIFPFLTTKPPVCFLLFYSIARYFKVREMGFIKHGKTSEDYEAYLRTNHNSFSFSKHLTIRIVIYSLIDLLLLFLFSVLHIVNNPSPNTPTEIRVIDAVSTVNNWGFGETASLLPIAPLMLLFSYTRTHKNKLIDFAVPVVGAGMVFAVYFDGLYKAVCEFLKSGIAPK